MTNECGSNGALPNYYRYWGKARKDEELDGADYHLLVYHSLDVAAVASVWWDHSPALRNSFKALAEDVPMPHLKAWVLFFIALHDYGKFDIRFQRKVISVWEKAQEGLGSEGNLPTPFDCKSYDHGSAGLFWFEGDEKEQESLSDEGWISQFVELAGGDDKAREAWLAWVKAVTGHHGFVYSEYQFPDEIPSKLGSYIGYTFEEGDRSARLAWRRELERLFLEPVGLSLSDSPPAPSPLLAGFCSVADWLGSRSDETNFYYKSEPVGDLRAYFQLKCSEDAPRVLALAGITGLPKPFGGVQALLRPGFQPRQLQTLVNDLPVSRGLTIVEAPTGSGKTEMALAYAWRLIEKGLADSIVVAMPTQATANAMLTRLEQLATTLFGDKPNVILAHGNARFNEEFIKLKKSGDTAQGKEEAWAQCNEWLGQSRKRIFLGQIGICTIDQVLVSVLPVKHRFVRGFGVGRSVLIVDEVHAYDAYMYGLLQAVLKAQHDSGGSSILLSATLNNKLRRDLLVTYGAAGKTDVSELPYPLISWSGMQEVRSFTLPADELPEKRSVEIECLLSDDLLPDNALCHRIVNAAEQGAQVAIICNLVDVAQQLARDLQGLTNAPVELFHARYCLHDRQQKEEKVLNHFGTGERNGGRILVATQVVEQSLDVDFDWVITQLCPVDLLFQRIGRLHRHNRPQRPAGFESPICSVLLPHGTDYGTHGLIYGNTRVLWRTAQKLQALANRPLVFPGAYRDWIESIYSEEPWGSEPADVEAGYAEFENKVFNKRSMAGQMLRWANDWAMLDGDENIRAVTRDGEFNLTVIPFRDSMNGKQLLDGSLFENQTEWQQAESLTMNSVGVPKSWGKYLPEMKDGQIWLAMEKKGDRWSVSAKNMEFSYHPIWGMEKLQ